MHTLLYGGGGFKGLALDSFSSESLCVEGISRMNGQSFLR